MRPMSATATAANNSTKTTTAMRLTTARGVSLRLGGDWCSDNPDVCAESGGVDPGGTPPPGSRSGTCDGSGSGGIAVMGVKAFARSVLTLQGYPAPPVPHGQA